MGSCDVQRRDSAWKGSRDVGRVGLSWFGSGSAHFQLDNLEKVNIAVPCLPFSVRKDDIICLKVS